MAKKMYIGVPNFEKVTLPSGYTQVEYIEKNYDSDAYTGQPYIDTGFKPNQNTKVVIECQLTSTDNSPYIFGAQVIQSTPAFGVYHDGTKWVAKHGSNTYNLSTGSGTDRVTITMEKGLFAVGSSSVVLDSATFQLDNTIFLCALANGGSVANFARNIILYSCKIYDNGTLVRDFIPCKNKSKTVGLYDLVNSKFYQYSSSTYYFFAGTSEHKSSAREVKQMYVGVSGVARNVKKGYIGVDGVARQFYAGGTPISEFAVGDTVKLNVNGTPLEFIIIQKGTPSTKYAGASDGVWLMMKNLYTTMKWDSADNDYANSDVHTYLNGTFLGLLDSYVQSIISTVKIPYNNGNASVYPSNVKTGSSGLSTKVFLLSVQEMNLSTRSEVVDNSTLLSYFSSCSADSTASKRVAKYNNSAYAWWTRTPVKNYQKRVFEVTTTGTRTYSNECTNSKGIRPVLVLPNTALVSDELIVTD